MNFSNLTASHIRVHTGCKTFITYLLVELMLFRFTDKKKYKKFFFSFWTMNLQFSTLKRTNAHASYIKQFEFRYLNTCE